MDEVRFVEIINEEIAELSLEIQDCPDSLVPVKGLQLGTLQKLLRRVQDETGIINDAVDFK
jgi:hypothetical protein